LPSRHSQEYAPAPRRENGANETNDDHGRLIVGRGIADGIAALSVARLGEDVF
jgi:hypothetical protein